MDINAEIKLKYREEFRSVHGEAFQIWFEKFAVALHGDDCFLAIRVTRGDGGLDGLALKEGRVYQLYAPPSLATDSSTAIKVASDFNKAKETLGSSLKIWTFLHNSSDGKVGHLTAKTLARLNDENPDVRIEALGIDGLWERLEKLTTEKLSSLFGISESPNHLESKIRSLLKRATELANQDKRRKAFEAMEEALVIAETEKLVHLQAEVLIGLSLLSSARGGIGDRGYYFQRLESLNKDITEVPVLVMYHRAHGAYLEEKRDFNGAESAYLEAIELASLPANIERCDEQLCVARSEYVHLLCNANRNSEAEDHLKLAEAYAKRNPNMLDGEVFQAALNAGIHWAVKSGDEDAAISRVYDLEASARNSYLSLRIAGQLINVANNSSHAKRHSTALAASEAALRLADRTTTDTRKNFLPGVLYTVALVNFQAGRLDEALQKAKSLLNIAASPEIEPIRFATTQLVSVISRQLGDLATAVEKAEIALELASDVESSFMAKLNLAEALADSGETERAFKLVQEAQHLVDGRASIPMHVQVDIAGHIADYAAQLGYSVTLQSAMSKLPECPTDDEKVAKMKKRYIKRVEATMEIRKRIIDISGLGQGSNISKQGLERLKDFSRFLADSSDESNLNKEPILTLHQANALTVGPILKWWDDTADDYNAAALDYDYWGRGCFAQILQNLQAFPHSLNITLEVRTLHDIRQAVRFWALYADFMLLLWKGPTTSGEFLHFVDGEYFGPWGAGYMVALGDEFKSKKTGRQRFAALGYASWLPDEVAQFLITEAKPFFASGRLLLVPASGVGCVSPGHGVMEQLLTEAANCIPAIQHSQISDLEIGLLPYAPDVPLDILYDFIDETNSDLIHMRQLLLSKTTHIRANGLQQSPKIMELEIADTLKRLRAQNTELANRRDLSAVEQGAHISVAPFRIGGHNLFQGDDALFSPLLLLESMGYGWKIGRSAQSSYAYRYEPAEGEAIGAWLAPAECGVSFPVLKPVEESDA